MAVHQRISKYLLATQLLLLIAFSASVHGEYGHIAGAWKVSFGGDIQELRLPPRKQRDIAVNIYDVDLSSTSAEDFYFELKTDSSSVAEVVRQRIAKSDFTPGETLLGEWHGWSNITGLSLGYGKLYAELTAPVSGAVEVSPQHLPIIVMREERVDDQVFTYTAAALIMFMFINLGTALDLQRLKSILLRPIGVTIAFCLRYIVMPAIALGLGHLFFPHNKQLQLALFFTALAPSGGLANICNIFLKGNVNLSIATTTINSLLALAMLPLWLNALGSLVYSETKLAIPFMDLAISSAAIILAIGVGVTLRLCMPKTTRFVFRFLKPLSVLLSLGLIALTVAINAFVFRQLTLMIILASLCLPIIAYLVSVGLSLLLCRTRTDSLTIAIETSVLNMTVPMVLIQYSFDNPQADMIIVVPIMASLMSFALVTIFYVVRRLCGWNTKMDEDAFDEKDLLAQNN